MKGVSGQYNKNKLNERTQSVGGSGGQSLVLMGVGLIVLALLIFGFLFFFSGGDDSSSQADDVSESQAQVNSQTDDVSDSPAQVSSQQTDSADSQAKPADTAQMSVHFIDCGQGDCTLIISGGEAMLIDCGEMDDSNKVINYIKQQGVESFKYIIVTHPHTDHMGEMTDILKTFKTENFIMPKVPDSMVPTIMRYEKMLKQVDAQGLKVTWSSDDTFKLGGAEVKTFTPKQQQEDLNNYSTLVKVSCAGKSVLITGDCETAEEKDIMSQGFDLKADVLKVGHHGSYKASSYEFLETVIPSYAVISCGKDNDYGHPHDAAMNRLRKKVENIYITKDNGTIVCEFSDNGLTVTPQKGQKYGL